MATKKNTVELNVLNHKVIISDSMKDDEIDQLISYALHLNSKIDEQLSEYKIPNAQLEAENKTLNEINNKLNFNIEIQVMFLNLLKQEIGNDKYQDIRNKVLTSPEYLKLKSRAGL